MADIIRSLANVGEYYASEEKRIKNDAYKYSKVKTYLLDIKTKSMEPTINLSYEDLIIVRFGPSAASGNLFPIVPYISKEISDSYDKFVRGVLKANKNLLSYFSTEEIERDDILKTLSQIDNNFFSDIKDEMQKLTQEKGRGVATYIALSFGGSPISAYFKNIFEKHLNKNTYLEQQEGYDILTNDFGVGGDARLPFCSVNELPKKMQTVKYKLLPVSTESAKKINIGYDAVINRLSYNFEGVRMAIIPTVLSSQYRYEDVLPILEAGAKNQLSEIKDKESYIGIFLENVAFEEQKRSLPVLNTLLFFEKVNSAVNLLLQIDDVLPSKVTNIVSVLQKYKIKISRDKDAKDAESTIYLRNIFPNKLEAINLLLSNRQIDKNTLVDRVSLYLYYGNANKKYGHKIDWSKFFNAISGYRSAEKMIRYVTFLNEIGKVRGDFTIMEGKMGKETDLSKEGLLGLLGNPFLSNNLLKSAYLLGMLSSSIIAREYALFSRESYKKWLNGIGVINKEKLPLIWKKSDAVLRKLMSSSKQNNSKAVQNIYNLAAQTLAEAISSDDASRSAYISLAFALGGSDYTKIKKMEDVEK